MGNYQGCGEFVRSGENAYILDTKKRALGATAIPYAIYLERREMTITTGDARHLFDNNEQHGSFTANELDAMVSYAKAGGLSLSSEHVPVIAFENMCDLVIDDVSPVLAR